MNLATFRTRCQRAIGLTNSTEDLALIDGFVNEGIVKFLSHTKMYTRKAALSVTADQADYELDTDIIALDVCWYDPTSSSQSRLLEITNPTRLTEMQLLTTVTVADVRYIAINGANMVSLFPTPQSSSDVLHIRYVPRPAALSATADSPAATANGGIPEEFHDTLEAYAKWKLGETEEHAPSQMGQVFKGQWDVGLRDAMALMNRKAGVRKADIIPGRRPRSFATPGMDDGR